MKKLMLTVVSVSALSLGLIGCGFHNNDTVGMDDKDYAVKSQPTAEAHVVKVGGLAGKTASKYDRMVYEKDGVVMHNGHSYHITNGRYVLVR